MERQLKQIAYETLMVGSGKGGVGKSTVTVNLAVALARKGLRVGILDADLYGPSVPVMTGLRQMSPEMTVDGAGQQKFLPFEKFGVKIFSLGFFLDESKSILWRGPMLHGMLQKMVFEVEWGVLDILLIDLPPGTGDVPLSLSQILTLNGALIVTTPQELAAVDALKAINALEQLDVPILGVIENMAGFTAPDTQVHYPIFGEGKGEELAHRAKAPLLTSIPLLPAIRQGGDEGIPSAFHSGDEGAGRAFMDLAAALVGMNANLE